MKTILLALAACICVACGNNRKSASIENEPAPIIIKPTLDSALYASALEIIEAGQRWIKYKSPPPPISEGCLVMVFDVNPDNKLLFFSDSIVGITHKTCGRTYPLEAYKGVLSIDSCRIAVFDKYEIGDRYYNPDSLKMIPFDQFKCFPIKTGGAISHYIRNNTLYYWNP